MPLFGTPMNTLTTPLVWFGAYFGKHVYILTFDTHLQLPCSCL